MNWSLFLLNQLLEDVLAAQTGRPFTYRWLLVLIALVAWMEPEDYQPMAVDAVKVRHGARYQNLWWVKEPSQQEECAIHFWVYWETLQDATIVIPRFSPYAMVKYQRILRFSIGPHSIHIQARWDPDWKWIPLPYKFTMEYLDTIVQDWPRELAHPSVLGGVT